MTDQGQQHIPVGYVRRAHGIRGDVVVRGLVADADERFTEGADLMTGQTPPVTLRITSKRMNGTDYLLHLDGIDSRDDAEGLVGTQFVIDRGQRRSLDDDEWWVEDLMGCAVVDVSGDEIGTVTDVVVGGAQDRLVVTTLDGGHAEIPFVDELVPEVDMGTRRIVVDLPDGLIE